MTRIDLAHWLDQVQVNLRGKTEFPSIEVHAIVSHVLGITREWIITHPDVELTTSQLIALDGAVDRLIAGEPLAYITGNRHFYGLNFQTNPKVLIPRPETELLVDLAIDWLNHHPGRRVVADVGTGSGAIAVSVAHNVPDARLIAVDVSPEALDVARANATCYGLQERTAFHTSDLLLNIDQTIDLLLANLPYIPSDAPELRQALKYEPRLALDGGSDGLDLITRLLHQAEKKVAPGGCVILEIQYNQNIVVMEKAASSFPQAVITLHRDLASLPRIVKIQLAQWRQ